MNADHVLRRGACRSARAARRGARQFAFGAIAVAVALCLRAGPLAAQPYPNPPEPGPARDVAIATPFEHTLANGLRVIVAERPGVPLVTALLVVGSGSEADPATRAGLASMTSELLVKGTRRHSAPQIAQAAEALGGSLGTSAGWHAASVGITVTTPKLPAALALVSEVVRTPTFAPDELERARAQALDGLRVALADPGRLAGHAAARAVFGASVYGEPAGGTPASLARIVRADLVRAHAAAYRPDNAVLILAGDLTPARALELANAQFGDWARPKAPLAHVPVAPAQPIGARLVIVDLPGAGQAGVVAGLPSIRRDAPDWAQGVVANAVLGRGYSSRLNQEIRIKRGLSYGAGSGLDARREGGAFSAATQTKNESAAEVVGLIRAEVARMSEALPADDELAARKATLIGDYGRSLETTSGLASNIAALVAGDVPLADLGQRIATYAAVTPAQVQAFARAHWPAGELRTVVVGDARRFGAELRTDAPDALVIPRARLDLDRPDLVAP